MLSLSAQLCLALLLCLPRVAPAEPAGAEQDWEARANGPHVITAVNFADRKDWLGRMHEKKRCNPRYAPGCFTNAWDPAVSASGGASLRFDILSGSGPGDFGNIVIDFSAASAGAGDTLWIQWRQRFDAYVIDHEYAYTKGQGAWKQVILAQANVGDNIGWACSENQIVVQNVGVSRYPSSYIECLSYQPFAELLGKTDGRSLYTRQNRRPGCTFYPPGADTSGCAFYHPDEWMSFMIHLEIGQEGVGKTSAGNVRKPGFVDSVYELYVGREGQRMQLVHRQEKLVLPRGQHWKAATGRNPDVVGDPGYVGGWRPNNAHPQARYGRLWLTPFTTGKDPAEVHEDASIWYDEIIVSTARIPDPGFAVTATPGAHP